MSQLSKEIMRWLEEIDEKDLETIAQLGVDAEDALVEEALSQLVELIDNDRKRREQEGEVNQDD